MKTFKEPVTFEVTPEISLQIPRAQLKKNGLNAHVQCWNGTLLHSDTFCLDSDDKRRIFARAVEKVVPGVLAQIEAALLKIGPGLSKHIESESPEPAVEESKVSSTAARFVRVVKASDAEFFWGEDEKAYVTVTVDEHRETYRIQSRDFKHWLSRHFYSLEQKTLSSQAMQEVLQTLEGSAQFEGEKRRVHLRLGSHENNTYWDLADSAWRQIEISQDGWKVIEARDSPVRFRRGRGMRPLPVPVRGGDLLTLKRFINLPDERALILFISWLIGALRADANAYPVLCLTGEQGTAKSTAARFARMLIDPNIAPLRAHSRDERDLAITAQSSHVVAFDNLSILKQAESDALCRLSTGGALSTRELYSNDEETLFSAVRPIIITAITEICSAPDLTDRSILIEHPPVPDEERLSDRDIQSAFEKEYPALIGALCEAVSMALREVDRVVERNLMRMADFTQWIIAAEPSFTTRGTFLEAYKDAREKAAELSVRASAVAEVVREWFDGNEIEITLTLLLKQLNETYRKANGEKTQFPAGWPKTSKGLSNELRRCSPILRRIGISITDAGLSKNPKDRSAMRRFTRIEKSPTQPSEPSQPSSAHQAPTDQQVRREGYGGSEADLNVMKVVKDENGGFPENTITENVPDWGGMDDFGDLGPESLAENNWQ